LYFATEDDQPNCVIVAEKLANGMRDQVAVANDHAGIQGAALEVEVGGGVGPGVGAASQADGGPRGPGVAQEGGELGGVAVGAELEVGGGAGVAAEVAVVGVALGVASEAVVAPAATPLQRKWASLLKATASDNTPVWCLHDGVWVGGLVLSVSAPTAVVKLGGGSRVTKTIEQELLPKHVKGVAGIFQAVRVYEQWFCPIARYRRMRQQRSNDGVVAALLHKQIISKTMQKYVWMAADGTSKGMPRKGKSAAARVDHQYRMTAWPDAADA
jgi:hypothetical protein